MKEEENHRGHGVKEKKILCTQEYPLEAITDKIIGSYIEVHRHLGSGLLESIYEEASSYEFKQRLIL